MNTIAVLQSNYLPWKGYFDIINDVDVFIFYDDVQYTKRNWRNRNKIKTSAVPKWLTVPVGASHRWLICEVAIKDDWWQKKHWKRIVQNYAKAPFFENYRAPLEHIYLGSRWRSLSQLNQTLIRLVAREFLGIEVEFRDSREFSLAGEKKSRLLDLLRQVGATRYVSGPVAKDYLLEADFARAGIDLVWKDYRGYPEYPQFHPPFDHQVSILDLLFQTGPRAADHIWGWR